MNLNELYVVFNATASDIVSVHGTRPQAVRAWQKFDNQITMIVYLVMTLDEAITKMLAAESFRTYVERKYDGYGGD